MSKGSGQVTRILYTRDIRRTVDVRGAAFVVARDQGVKSGHALVVSVLDAAKDGAVDEAQVVRVTVAGIVQNAAVDALQE